MTIWYIIILTLFIFASLEVAGMNRISVFGNHHELSNEVFTFNKLVFIYVACVLAFLSAFRFETGRDWENYIRMFNEAEERLKTGTIEKGYIALNWAFKNAGLSYWCMQACILLFCSWCLFRSFYRKSTYPLYTLAIYFCLYFFSNDLAQTRQYIAMSVLILGLVFIEKKKFVFWFLTVILAMQFHVTAITAFPLYFTSRIKISPWQTFVILLACLFLNLFGLELIWKVMEFTVNIKLLPDRINSILWNYMQNSEYNKQVEYSTGLGLLLQYGFYFIVLLLYYARYQDKRISESFVLNFLIGILFSALGRNFSQFSRIGNYYVLCGGGVLAYNIIPESFIFFKKADVFRMLVSLLWLLFLVYDFLSAWIDEIEYSYRTFLLI